MRAPTLVKPEAILAWYRKFDARKHEHSAKHGPARPRKPDSLRELIVRMADKNPSWGYPRIMDALANLGHVVSRGTIANVLLEHGVPPAPDRGKRTNGHDFFGAHWDVLGATDFFSIDVLMRKGVVTPVC
ncbi:MAG: IS3 family transposase [Planctomycetota bacterium]